MEPFLSGVLPLSIHLETVSALLGAVVVYFDRR